MRIIIDIIVFIAAACVAGPIMILAAMIGEE